MDVILCDFVAGCNIFEEMNAEIKNMLADIKSVIAKDPESHYTLSRRLELAQSLINSAEYMAKVCKEFPRNGKRNPFVKTYNRRPMNKEKRVRGMIKLSMGAMRGATDLANIISQPLPKFPVGSTLRLPVPPKK